MLHYHPDLKIETIIAGKFRRYHKLPVWQQIMNFHTIGFPNFIDFIKTILGTIQSFYKLLVWRPDVVFTKGGFVCLPVGVAAHFLRIPLAIHESDAHSGLTNRILSRWADVIATGTAVANYSYPREITHYIGIPIEDNLKPLDERERKFRKRKLGFDDKKPLVIVTGGGLGAKCINDATVAAASDIVGQANLLLVSGTLQFDELKERTKALRNESFQLKSYVEGLADVLACADIVVSRAGATTLLELAALAMPTILIPNAHLTGGHQVKNAKAYESKKAVVLVDEDLLGDDPQILSDTINNLISDTRELQRLASAIHQFAKPYAAKEMAHLILSAAKKRTHA